MALNIGEVLANIKKGSYNPQYQTPEEIAQRVVTFQKQQRALPTATALQGLGAQLKQAPDRLTELNAKANQLRQAYVASGGSPMDLEQNLWGMNPNEGFQIGQGQFHSPAQGDNLSLGQKRALSEITGMYEGKPTFGRQVEEAGLTGLYQGKDTLQKTMADRDYELGKGQLSISRMNAGSGGSSGPSTAGERKLQATSDLFDWGIKAYETQKAVQWKDYQSGKTKDYPSPLYGTVEAFLTNPQIINASMSSGANRLQALDDLIRTYAGQSPDEYFKQGRAAKLKPLYDSLALRYSQQQGDGNAIAALISALAGRE